MKIFVSELYETMKISGAKLDFMHKSFSNFYFQNFFVRIDYLFSFSFAQVFGKRIERETMLRGSARVVGYAMLR